MEPNNSDQSNIADIVQDLPSNAREYFAMLAPFAPNPATFDAEAFAAVAQVTQAKTFLDLYVARGLLNGAEDRYSVSEQVRAFAESLLEP